MKNILILITFLFIFCSFSSAKDIKGRVTDSETREPIPGANIIIKGTDIGTVSDINGYFTLKTNIKANNLIVSFLGYISREIAIGEKTENIEITLKEDSKTLEEVVVVGYGVQKKKLNTGSTINVKGQDLEKLNTVSPLGALQSQAPGVNITQQSGMPGQGFLVTIRGLGTNGNSSPLYVIDGIVGGDINNLNPSDIEAIDVLKDAASSAIYGSRAANGVILVTTKQGKEGKIQVSYDGYYGIQNLYKTVPTLNAKEYITIQDEMNFNDGVDPKKWNSLIPVLYNKVVNENWKGTNWIKEMTNKNAPIQNHALNIAGGNQMSRYSIGLSYTSQDGILGKPAIPVYDRITVRINSDHILYKNEKKIDVLKFGESINYNYHENKGINIGNMWANDLRNAINASPLMPLYDTQGNYFDYEDVLSSGYNFIAENGNPIAKMDYDNKDKTSKNHGLNANLYFEIQPIKDLILRSSFGYRLIGGSSRSYVPIYQLTNIIKNDDQKVAQSIWLGNSLQLENTISYKYQLKDHEFTGLVGQSVEKSNIGETLGITNVNYIFNDYKHAYIDNTDGYTAGKTLLNGSPWGINKLMSFFGRIGYNFKEKYMATIVMRADGSSNFAKGHRWGYFPSISAGWVISEENFISKSRKIIDFLKLRASWGQNGNSAVPGFQYLATISYTDNKAPIHYPFGKDKDPMIAGAYPDILPNPKLSWETSDQINIGFDARFLDSRLSLTFDWYQKSTKDWLVKAPQLLSYGTGAPYINGGDVVNKGVEFSVRWNEQIKDFNYGAYANFSYNKNEVLRIANSEGVIYGASDVLSQGTSPVSRIEVGKPMGYFWGYKSAGVFQNQEEIAAIGTTLQENAKPGDLIFVDTNNDGVINESDKTMIGNPHPDLNVSFGFNASYKGFDFSITANGAFGQQIMKSYRSFSNSPYQNYTTDIFKRWHGEGTSNRLPKITNGGNTNWKEISDIYVEDGDYLKIQNITLGYDFKKLFKNIVLSKMRIYVSAQNVFTFTKYSGMDPEIGYRQNGMNWATGVDLGFYPTPRMFMFGANISF